MRSALRALLFSLVLLLALPALAQEATPEGTALPVLALNTPLSVKLDNGPADVIYTAADPETVTVSARGQGAAPLDVTLEVLDTRRVRLAFNDDHGTTSTDLTPFDSLIEGLELPRAGEYIIRVSTFNGVGEGSVEVLVTDSAPSASDATPETGSRGSTETITGTVPDNERYTTEFSAAADETVTITVRATDNVLDPRVSLMNAAGEVLTSNDDHSSNDASMGRYDSRIANFVIPETAIYSLEISGFGGTGGEFELTIARGSGEDVVTPDSNTLETTQVLEGAITLQQDYEYNFDANAGDVLTLTAQAVSSDLDVDLWVYDENEGVVGTNYEHGSSDASLGFYDARIDNLIIQETGAYRVVVTGYEAGTSDFGVGDVTLTIERVLTDAPVGEGEEQVFLGELTANSTAQQSFEAQAGDFVTITVRSLDENLDPLVDLLSPNGVILANNDDHGSRSGSLAQLDSRISNFLISEDGLYTAEVGGYRDSAGAFAITVSIIRAG